MALENSLEECRAAAALYALGALPAREARQFEQRLDSGCPFCVAELADFAEVADRLAMTAPEKKPPASLRDRVLRGIAIAERRAARMPEKTVVRGNDSPWIQLPILGVETRPLLGDKTLLVRMEPGSRYPSHEHQQAEQCYVLEGNLTDASGFTVSAGDFVCMPAGSTHERLHSESGCVLLIAYT